MRPHTTSDPGEEIVLATFELDDIHIALNTRHVREAIILENPLVPWPSSQEYVDGIMDLRGRIVPVINLKKRLHRPRTDYAADCRVAIVALRDLTIGILFDGVKDVIRVSSDRLENLCDALQGEDHIISGVLNHTESGRLVQIMDPRRLVPASVLEDVEGLSVVADSNLAADNASYSTIELVIFSQNGQEFALGIQSVREVEVVEEVDDTFKSALIEGTVTIHDCQLPLIQLAPDEQTKGRNEAESEESKGYPKHVVILSIDDNLCAVAIDKICEMIAVKEKEIMKLSLRSDDSVIGVIQPSEGRSILVLDPNATFRNHLRDIESMNNIFKRDSIADFAGRKKKRASQSLGSTDRSYLFFEVDELFAIDLQCIQEILPPMGVIVPPTPQLHMDGILNLRKTLMPQFSMRSFLGLEAQGELESQNRKVIVLKAGDHMMALMVDNILNFSSSLKETRVPTLNRRLDPMRGIFKSLIVSQSESGERRHALRIDPDALLNEMYFKNQIH